MALLSFCGALTYVGWGTQICQGVWLWVCSWCVFYPLHGLLTNTHTQSVSEVRQTWRQTSSCSAATLGTTHLTKLVFSSWKQEASPPLHMWQGLVGRTLDVRERKTVRGCGVCWDRQQSEGSRESEGTSCTTEPSTHLITTWWKQEEVT